MTTIFQVEKIGPYGLLEERVIRSTGKKTEIMSIARVLAETDAKAGADARIEVLDIQGRVVRIETFFADKYAQQDLADEERAHQEATEAAKAAVS